MTFTVTDALMSPMGMAVLTGAGLINPSKKEPAHVHCTIQAMVKDGVIEVDLQDLKEETGLQNATSFDVCKIAKAYGTVLDGSGAGIDYIAEVTITGEDSVAFPGKAVKVSDGKTAKFTVDEKYNGKAVEIDFYLLMTQGVTEIEIKPEDFGGYFYVEAQTLYRREDTGKDMAAELIIPKVKVQSGMSITMAANGDPSTFDFVMDAMPAYTWFDKTKKIMCAIQIVGTDNDAQTEENAHVHDVAAEETPVVSKN